MKRQAGSRSLVACFVLFVLLVGFGYRRYVKVPQTVVRHPTEAGYLQQWLSHQVNHPSDFEDRLTFAEMAFQTSTYSAMIRDTASFDEHALVQVEQKMYPWINNLARLRKNAIDRSQKPQSSIRNAFQRPMSTENRQSKGIVITGGNRQFTYMTQLIATIRFGLKSDLPIEVYYYGQDDLDDKHQDFLTSRFHNLRTIDLEAHGQLNESFVRMRDGSWALKPYAMLMTNLTEVMLLDADSVLLADPDDFFLEPGYRRTGTLFFHDRLVRNWKYDTLHTFLREQMGDRQPSRLLRESIFWREGLRHRQESGLVVLNKANPDVFAALIFIVWQNAGLIRDYITYNIFYGDKETFWLPFELSGFPYHFSRYWAGALGLEQATHAQGFCSDHILHFFEAPYASPSLQSKATDKSGWKRGRPAWINGSLRNNKLWDPDEGVMDYKKAIWTMDGTWKWRPAPESGGMTCCVEDYTRWSMEDLNLGDSLGEIFRAGRKVLDDIEELVE